MKITGFPVKYFVPFALIILIATYTGALTDDFTGALGLLLVLGAIFFWIGSKIPVFNTWFGGAIVLPLFAGSAMVYFDLLPIYAQDTVKHFMKGGFPNFFIAAILIGSILCMNRKELVKVSVRLLPCIIVSQIFVFIFLYLGSIITGVSPLDGIFKVGMSSYAGGSSGALVTVPAILSDIFGTDAGSYVGPFLVFINISNLIAVIFGALLNKVGKVFPQWTGNGHLMPSGEEGTVHAEERPSVSSDYKKLTTGLLIACVFMLAGNVVALIIPQVNAIAWTAIIVIFVKAFGLLSDDMCDCSNYWYSFIVKNFLPVLITGIGIASLDFSKVLTYFSLSNFVILFFGVFGGLIGSIIAGKFMRLYPIDAGIAVGLQICNLGGSGAVSVLSTCERMKLMPFATIANRVGGALMLLEISFLIQYFI